MRTPSETPEPSSQPSKRLRFRRDMRLAHREEYQRIFARRCSAREGQLLVFGLKNDLGHARLGLSVSRKVGPAVVRNRWKRLIREAFRLSYADLPPGLDLIAIPVVPNTPDLAAISRALVSCARRIARRVDDRSDRPSRT